MAVSCLCKNIVCSIVAIREMQNVLIIFKEVTMKKDPTEVSIYINTRYSRRSTSALSDALDTR